MKLKHLSLLSLFLFLTIKSNGQHEPCLCETIGKVAHFAPAPITSQPDAQTVVNDYANVFHGAPIITVKTSTSSCESMACAIICPLDERKYIFYNQDFFKRLQTKKIAWGDRFVLAHEIAHHILGHTTWLYHSSTSQWQTLNGNFPSPNPTSTQKLGNTQKKYLVGIPRLYLQELEADIVGLMMLRRKGFKYEDLNQMLYAIPNTDVKNPSFTHPSSAVRRQFILDQFPRKSLTAMNTQSDTTNDLIDIESIGHKTEAAYAFYLQNPDQVSTDSLSKRELVMRDSLIRRSRFPVEAIIGTQFQEPVLVRNSTPVMATANRNIYAGIRVGIGAWYRPHRAEVDLIYSANAFETKDSFGDEALTVERFQMKWLSLRPRYVFSHLLNRSPSRYRTHGFMFTGGASVRFPFSFTYENSTVTSYNAPTLQTSVNWIAGVGYNVSNWRNNRQIRIYLLYEPQVLCFQTTAPDPIQATLRTLSIECSFRFWKL